MTKKSTADLPIDPAPPEVPATEPAPASDPVGKPVDPVPVTVVDIPANEPYPTGSPQEPTYAEINGIDKIGG